MSYTNSQDCGSPLDCYTKAYQQLQKDREEMRNLKSYLESLIITQSQTIEENANKKIINITNEFKTDFQRQIDELRRNNTQEFQMIHTNINVQFDLTNQNISKVNSDVADLKKVNVERHYIYKDAVIHHEILNALDSGIVSKYGNPSGWDSNSYRVTLWNKRRILNIGVNYQANGNGLKTTIPEGYNVIWLRVLNERWAVFRAAFIDQSQEQMGKFTCGKRSLNELSPDGTTADSFESTHMWCNIPVSRSGQIAIYTDIFTEGWISGIAFGKNLWNHARNSALAYHWVINGGTAITWGSDNWNGDIFATIPGEKVSELIVPVHPSDKDKLLYIVEHNNNWNGIMHTNIYVKDKLIERFRSTYENPFARHFNSKLYSRYFAARIPKELINSGDRFISVKIYMTNT